MVYKRALETEIDQLTELRIAYLLEDHGKMDEKDLKILKKNLPDYFKRNLNRNIIVYIARDGQIIVACAFLLLVEKPMSPAFITGRTGMVLNVYTRPEYRHNGYARKLMELLLEEAEGMELSAIELKATDEGYNLYKSVGFEDAVSKYHLMNWHKEYSANDFLKKKPEL